MSDITYTQKIFAVDVLPEVDGLSNVIGRVKWEYRAQDGVHVAWTVHTTDLDLSTIPEYASQLSGQTYGLDDEYIIENFGSLDRFKEVHSHLDEGSENIGDPPTESEINLFESLDIDATDAQTDFVFFHDVTEEMVLSWINSVVDLEPLKLELRDQLESSITQFLEKDPPWETRGDNVLTREYLLVHEGGIIWGPASWNTQSINDAISDVGLSVSLPNVVAIIPETQPLVIGTDTILYRAKKVGHIRPGLIDDNIYDVSDFEWDFSSGIAIGEIAYEEKSLEDMKESMLFWLRGQRFTNYFKPGHPISFEYLSQLAKTAMFYMSSDDNFDWLDVESLDISNISKQDLKVIIDGVVQHEKDIDYEIKTKADIVKSAQTTEELINFYTQWKNEIE